ncbi:MAG: lysostaphin resistance A-like protein [Enterococcus sp.]
MSLKKYSFWSIFCYGIVFVSPVVLNYLGVVHTAEDIIFATTIAYTLGAVVLLALYAKQKEPLAIEKAVKKASFIKIIFYGVIGIFIAILLQNLAVYLETLLFGASAPSQNTQDIVKMILANPAFIVATSFAGPIMEELVFRRSILGLIARYSNFWIGALISSILFALAHNDGHLLIYFFIGFFFALLYKSTGRIWTSMITHVGMNSLVIFVQLAVHYGWVPGV